MKTHFDYEFVYRDCGGDPDKIQRRVDRAISEAEKVYDYEVRLKAVSLAATICKSRKQSELKKGDRVRYYGCFNYQSEVTTATIKRVKGDLVYIVMDSYIDNGNKWVKAPCGQWAHRKQLRKLKEKNV